ncbi:MAG: ParA family protein [Nitrososphaerota archaeon]|jgi:septum site-determining protein MinD|nr:ParA family protein [Nitrososphaerota archaeon]
MGKNIAVHSYKGGTGKTSLSVNLAATFVKQGKKVALFDLDFRAPSIFTILKCEKTKIWLNDYLNGICKIDDILLDVSERIPNAGKFYVGPANPSTSAMRDMTTKDRKWETHAFDRVLALRKNLIKEQKFDYIIFDTSPGLQYSSMNAIVAADFVIITTTNDCSDVNGTKRMISDFYDMFENKTGIVLNKVLQAPNKTNGKTTTVTTNQIVKETYKVPLLGVLPCYCDVKETEGKCLFPQDKPDHLFTKIIAEMATKIEKGQIE